MGEVRRGQRPEREVQRGTRRSGRKGETVASLVGDFDDVLAVGTEKILDGGAHVLVLRCSLPSFFFFFFSLSFLSLPTPE